MNLFQRIRNLPSLLKRKPAVEEPPPPFELVPVHMLPPWVRRRLEKKAGHKLASHGLVAIPRDIADSVAQLPRMHRVRPDRLLQVTGESSGNSHQRRIQRRAEARALAKSPVA